MKNYGNHDAIECHSHSTIDISHRSWQLGDPPGNDETMNQRLGVVFLCPVVWLTSPVTKTGAYYLSPTDMADDMADTW